MSWIWYLVIYLVVVIAGEIYCGYKGLDDEKILMVMFWPALLVLSVIVAPFILLYKLGEKLRESK